MAIPMPASAQGLPPLPDLSEYYMDRAFQGIDQYHAPQDLDIGFYVLGDNLYNVAGDLLIRPGKNAQLTTGFGAGVNMNVFGSFLAGGATASATLGTGGTAGEIVAITPGNGGIGYAVAPAVTISDPSGTGAAAHSVLTNGVVTSVVVDSPGSGYTAPVITFAAQPVWLLFSANGKLYKIQDGSHSATEIKTQAGASLTLNSARVKGSRFGKYFYFIDKSSEGNLYYTDLTFAYVGTALTEPTKAPVALPIAASDLIGFDPNTASNDQPPQYARGVATAVADASLSGSSISAINIRHGGYYPTGVTPNITVLDPTGHSATFTVHMTGNQVSSVTVGGGGGTAYTSPVVVFTVPIGTQTNAFPESWTMGSGTTAWAAFLVSTLGWTASGMPMYGTGASSLQGTMGSLGAPSFYDTDANDGVTPLQWIIMDTPGGTFASPSSSNKAIQNVQHNDGSGDWATQFPLAFAYYQANIHSGVLVTCQPFSDDKATSSLAPAKSWTFQPKNQTGKVSAFPVISTNFDFSEIPQSTPIKSWQITFNAAIDIVPPGPTLNGGLCIAYLTGGPMWGNLIANPKGNFASGLWQAQQEPMQTIAGGWIADTATDVFVQQPLLTSLTKDARLTISFGGGQSFANIEFISVPLRNFLQNGVMQFADPSFAIVLRLLPTGGTYQEVPLVIDESGDFASGDLSTLTAAQLASITNAQIVFIDNPIVSGTAFSFNIGNLGFSGNLAVGFAPYYWLYTEVDSNGDTTLIKIIESDPTPFSNTVTPTGEFASVQLTLPSAPLNNGSGGTLTSDMFFLYRAGGTQPNDGIPTLVDAGKWSETWTFGAARTGDTPPGMQLNPNTYTSWGQNDQNGLPPPTGFKYFVDNTPDANLIDNPTLVIGKQPAPMGATDIARHQNRLWLSVGGSVISSWLLNSLASAGIYFNPTLDPTDPNAAIKGSGYITVGDQDTDPVVGMATFGTVLTVWKGLSVYFVDGYDPTNFGVNEYTAINSQGLVAPNGLIIADNVAYSVQQDGVYTFDSQNMQKISDAISAMLVPVLNEDGGVVSPSAYANIFCCYHGGRLLIFAPVVGGSANSVCYVWDSRVQQWVGRWLQMNFTSAVSIGSNTDTPDLWCGGNDGQIYRLAGNGDTSVWNGTVSAVAFDWTSRAYGRPPQGLSIFMQARYNLPLGIEDKAWEPFFLRGRPVRAWIEAYCFDNSVSPPTNQPITLTLGTENADTGVQESYTLNIDGQQRISVKCKPDRGGLGVILSLSGSTAKNLKIIASGVVLSRGARNN